jgi:hypothetical protein
VLPLYHWVYRFRIYVSFFRCKTLLLYFLNQNCNILYSEYLFYGLYVCTYVFLLCQKFFDIILVNNPLFYDGGGKLVARDGEEDVRIRGLTRGTGERLPVSLPRFSGPVFCGWNRATKSPRQMLPKAQSGCPHTVFPVVLVPGCNPKTGQNSRCRRRPKKMCCLYKTAILVEMLCICYQ